MSPTSASTMKSHPTSSETQQKHTVVCMCKHGVSDSWATKGLLERYVEGTHGHLADRLNIVARGVEPIRPEPQPQADGMLRGYMLTMDDVRDAVLLIIHGSNLYMFQQRFGREFASVAETAEYLWIREGRECQFVDKNVGHNQKRHVQGCCGGFHRLLHGLLDRKPLSNAINPTTLHAAEMVNERWLQSYHERMEHDKDTRKNRRGHKRRRKS